MQSCMVKVDQQLSDEEHAVTVRLCRKVKSVTEPMSDVRPTKDCWLAETEVLPLKENPTKKTLIVIRNVLKTFLELRRSHYKDAW